jgi:hypothetical protein
VNNTWLAFATEAVAASVALARRLGLDTGTVADALGGGPLVSTWQAAKLQRIAHGEFSAQFSLSLALNDVHLALQAAGGDRFAALACLADEWQQAVDQGLGEQDLTVVTERSNRSEERPDQAGASRRSPPRQGAGRRRRDQWRRDTSSMDDPGRPVPAVRPYRGPHASTRYASDTAPLRRSSAPRSRGSSSCSYCWRIASLCPR